MQSFLAKKERQKRDKRETKIFLGVSRLSLIRAKKKLLSTRRLAVKTIPIERRPKLRPGPEQKKVANILAESVVDLTVSSLSEATHLFFKDLSYNVGDLTLLHNITGYARPGMMIAMVRLFKLASPITLI